MAAKENNNNPSHTALATTVLNIRALQQRSAVQQMTEVTVVWHGNGKVAGI